MSVCLRCAVHVCVFAVCSMCRFLCVCCVQYMSVFTLCRTCLCLLCAVHHYMSVFAVCSTSLHVSVFTVCSTCLCLLCAVHVSVFTVCSTCLCVCCVQYMSLMAELGEGPPPKSTSAPTSHINRSNLFHNQMPPNPMVSTGAEPQKELPVSALAQHCMVLACPLLLGARNLWLKGSETQAWELYAHWHVSTVCPDCLKA